MPVQAQKFVNDAIRNNNGLIMYKRNGCPLCAIDGVKMAPFRNLLNSVDLYEYM